MIRSCPGAMEYVNAGRAMVKNGRIHLLNGQPIPNDGSDRGLKHGIDTWLAANVAPTPEASSVPVKTSHPIPFQRDAPPHTTLSFEAIWSEVHMAQITETTDPIDPSGDNGIEDEDSELYNLFEVLATERSERKKRDTNIQVSRLSFIISACHDEHSSHP
jgi:hypothetical protein